MQNNLAVSYEKLRQLDKALRVRQDVYSARLELNGEEDEDTLLAANNCAGSLVNLERFEEAKVLLRKITPVARRVLGDSHDLTLRMRTIDARALYKGPGATLDDTREAVTTLEDAGRIARRVLGGAHPITVGLERALRLAQAAHRAHSA